MKCPVAAGGIRKISEYQQNPPHIHICGGGTDCGGSYVLIALFIGILLYGGFNHLLCTSNDLRVGRGKIR